MKKNNFLLILFLILFSCFKESVVEKQVELLHTVVLVKAIGFDSNKAIENAITEIKKIEKLINSYDPKSEVSKINLEAPNWVKVSPITFEAISEAKKVCELTSGALDITIFPLVKVWKFNKDFPNPEKLPSKEDINNAKDLVDYRKIELNDKENKIRLKQKGMSIDIGSFAKGYCVDKVIEKVKNYNLTGFLVACGGDIKVLGKKFNKDWTVGIRHPRDKNKLLSTIKLNGLGISTSGDYEKFYTKNGKKYTHIIDPRSGLTVEKSISVSVLSEKNVFSDSLSTALFVLGPDKGMELVNKLKNVEAIIISNDGKIFVSENFPSKEKINCSIPEKLDILLPLKKYFIGNLK